MSRSFQTIQMSYKVILAIVILLSFASTSFSAPSSNTSENQLVYALKNRDADIVVRKHAAEQILADYVRSSGTALIESIEDPNCFPELQNYIVELIVSSKNEHLVELLEKDALDSHRDLYGRKSALFALWKADSERAIRTARFIIENTYDNEAFRFETISYLAKNPDEPKNLEAITRVLKNKSQPINLRKAAFFYLESVTDKNVTSAIFQQTLNDTEELKGFRVLALQKLEESKSPTLTKDLMNILLDSKEKLAIRQTALESLSKNKENLVEYLPKFKSLHQRLKFGDFKESVRQLIRDLEKIKKASSTKLEQKKKV